MSRDFYLMHSLMFDLSIVDSSTFWNFSFQTSIKIYWIFLPVTTTVNISFQLKFWLTYVVENRGKGCFRFDLTTSLKVNYSSNFQHNFLLFFCSFHFSFFRFNFFPFFFLSTFPRESTRLHQIFPLVTTDWPVGSLMKYGARQKVLIANLVKHVQMELSKQPPFSERLPINDPI